jgi:hypothetical protein
MDIFGLFFMLSALQLIMKQKLLEASRKRMITLIERERKSRRSSRTSAGNDEPAWLSGISLHRH